MENPSDNVTTQSIIEPLYRGKIWMQILGVVSIISGILTALSIVGLIIAWLPIWAGVVLMQAAGATDRAYHGNESTEANTAMSKLRLYFLLMGVTMIVGFVFGLIGSLLGVGAMTGMGAM